MLINGTRTREESEEGLIEVGIEKAKLAGEIANAQTIHKG